MSNQLKYVPILRVRQEEVKVLKSFDFGNKIFPCLEIIKEVDRLPPKRKKNAKKPSKPTPSKNFEQVYIPLIRSIKAKKVFVDLPVHLENTRNMKDVTLSFLRSVVAIRATRTEYMKKLAPLADKVIPVISTYFNRTGETDSISKQTADLRPVFSVLAFRTFLESFERDIPQIEAVLKNQDYLIVDWQDTPLEESDSEQRAIVTKLKSMKCHVVIHRNAIPKELTNVGLVHGRVVDDIDNTLLNNFSDFAGNSFSDYSGIKKDQISNGGTISPGFVYYDAVKNLFYGYKSEIKDLSEFENTIVPAVIGSGATTRMRGDALDYLGAPNVGWRMIQKINDREESGRSPAKFKRIGMEHYLHCIKTRISNGDFD